MFEVEYLVNVIMGNEKMITRELLAESLQQMVTSMSIDLRQDFSPDGLNPSYSFGAISSWAEMTVHLRCMPDQLSISMQDAEPKGNINSNVGVLAHQYEKMKAQYEEMKAEEPDNSLEIGRFTGIWD